MDARLVNCIGCGHEYNVAKLDRCPGCGRIYSESVGTNPPEDRTFAAAWAAGAQQPGGAASLPASEALSPVRQLLGQAPQEQRNQQVAIPADMVLKQMLEELRRNSKQMDETNEHLWKIRWWLYWFAGVTIILPTLLFMLNSCSA